jgi:hypothetical protein
MRLLENPYVNAVLSQFEISDPSLEKSIGERTGTVDTLAPSGIDFVVTIDGGEMVVPNPVRRDKALGFVNVASTLLRMADLERMRADPWIDPREIEACRDSACRCEDSRADCQADYSTSDRSDS